MAHRSTLAPLALALNAALLVGCVPDFATDLSELRAPRLLAIASDPAETGAGKSVRLTALVALPDGASAAPLDWSLCLARKSLTELGPVNPLCLVGDDEPVAGADGAAGAAGVDEQEPLQQLGSGPSVEGKLSADVCKLFGPLRPTPMAGEAAGRPVDPDITGGFYQPVVARLGGEPSLGAIRIDCDPTNLNRDDALAFRRQYRQNQNPRLSSLAIKRGDALVELGDEPASVTAGSSVELQAGWDTCPDASECGDGYCTAEEDASNCAADCTAGQAHGCAGAERYVWYNREAQKLEARREAISVAWYASSGHFESEQTGLEESETRSSTHTRNVWRVGDSPGNATLWIVIRDSRGGQSWRIQRSSIAR
jgi:hypothetical protein